ncbi:MAG: isoprenylcysteine carboxylmethyltransferase family protein [Proteobacteria bacterium]|nr:isoprenylcysteine carboxylmethyltransferase family protein [Pseudomonadota bacterium]
MPSFRARIPPPALLVIFALGMAVLASALPRLAMSDAARLGLGGTLAAVALILNVSSFLAFRRAGTTFNPVNPGLATSLVTTGIYRFSRNPMYLCLSVMLCEWAVYLSSAWALVGVAGFMIYTDRLQIIPEEQALQELFGDAYSQYRSQVRRWL